MMVSNGNVTAIVDALQAQGLVTRTPSATDRRAQLVALTAGGRALFGRMAGAHEDWIAATFAGLSAAEAEQLMTLLGKAKASARKTFEGDAP